MMSEKNEPTFSQLRSPRAAAIAGILFSLLSMIIMVLVQDLVTVTPTDINKDWLETNSNTVSLALGLVPFAGIAFLWFTGVLRDWLFDWKDRFFSTIFFGSGILFVGMLFVWAAAFGAVFGTYAAASERLADGIFVFGHTFTNEILGDYTMRMAGVYMSTIGTIWVRTGGMPRWIIIITYIGAIVFVFFVGPIAKARFAFPCWVLLVSVYIFIYKYRRTDKLRQR